VRRRVVRVLAVRGVLLLRCEVCDLVKVVVVVVIVVEFWFLLALVVATVLVVVLGLQTCSDQERIDCNAVRTLKVVVDKDGLANQALGFVLVLGHDCIPEDWRWHATDKEDNPNPWPGPRMQP
jgi:hypothetical protein